MYAPKRVMLIDDDPLTSLMFTKINERVGFATEILTFHSAVDALDYLLTPEVPTPEVIFLDIRMPIVSGWQFLKQFKSLDAPDLRQTKVFMLTTSVSQSDMNRAKKFDSVADYIVKPLTAARLQAIQTQLVAAPLTTAH